VIAAMKITAQEEYGLRCLLRLARQPEGEPLTIPEISASERLSSAYVAKLMHILRQAELVDSARGRTGGYKLTRPADEISLGQALAVLGEPLFDDPGYCERHHGTDEAGSCVHTSDCAVRAVWRSLGDMITQVLDRVSLAELLAPESVMEKFLSTRSRIALPISPATFSRDPQGSAAVAEPVTE
jgi:Rrf2 family protein